MTDLTKLRTIAETATPGAIGPTWEQAALRDFYTTFDPPMILAMLDVIESARAHDHDLAEDCPLCAALARWQEVAK